MTEQPLEVGFKLTRRDHLELLVWQHRGPVIRMLVLVGLFSTAVGWMIPLALPTLPDGLAPVLAAVVALGSTGGILALLLIGFGKQIREHPEAFPSGEVRVRLTPEAVSMSRRTAHSDIPWGAVAQVQAGRRWVRLTTSQVTAVTVPSRAFPSTAARSAFVAEARRLQEAAVREVPEPQSAPDAWFALALELEPEDYAEWMLAVRRKIQAKVGPGRLRRLAVIPILGMLYAVCALLALLDGSTAPMGIPVIMTVFAAVVFGLRRWNASRLPVGAVRRTMLRDPGRLPAEFQLTVGPKGVDVVSVRGVTHWGWSDLTEVWELDTTVALMIGVGRGVVVPNRAFASTEEVQRFIALTGEAIERAPRFTVPERDERRAPGPPTDPFAAPEA
ncbi:MAG: hypothetical protein ACI8PZ_001002 [Myxococcota bacterium]|jgi:hypothetical protein